MGDEGEEGGAETEMKDTHQQGYTGMMESCHTYEGIMSHT